MPQVTASPQGGDDELRKQFDDDRRVVALKFQDDDLAIGTFVRYEKRTPSDPDFKPFPVAVLENPDLSGMVDPPDLEDDDLVSVPLFHRTARDQFGRLRPQKGERVAAKRIGKMTNDRTGRDFIEWRVAVPGRSSAEVSEEEIFGSTPQSKSESLSDFADDYPY